MDKFTAFLQQRVMPAAARIAGQRHLMAVRDGFISFMPFLIIGSLFLIIANFPLPGYHEAMNNLFGKGWDDHVSYPVDVTFGIMSLYIVAAIAFKLAQSYKVDPLAAAMLAIVSFLLLTPFGTVVDGKAVANVIPVEWLGSKGLFVALLVALGATELFRKTLQRGFVIRMPEGVPPAVAKAFASLLPAAVTILTAVAIRYLFLLTSYGSIHKCVYTVVTIPLQYVGSTLPGALVTVLATSLLWTVGLNGGTLVGGVMRPIWYPLQAENLAAYKAGLPLPYIITEQFFDLIWIGGAGATLSVVLIMVLRCRSRQHKELGRLSVGPGMFNINEPILFGLPVVLNPLLLIPFIIAPLLMTLVTYFSMDWGLVAKPIGAVLPWSTPPFIQGWLVTGSWTGAALQLALIGVGIVVYYPFIMMLDGKHLAEEKCEKNNEVEKVG